MIMNNECVICFETVDNLDKYYNICDCKYTAHIKCVSKWNEKCIMCNKPINAVLISVSDRRDLLFDRSAIFITICVIIGGIYAISVYGNLRI